MGANSTYRNKNYMKLMIGNIISSLGDYMHGFALTIIMYQITGRISAIAIMCLVRILAGIPSRFIADMLTDYYSKRSIIRYINFISIPISLIFLWIYRQDWVLLYILIFLLQTFNDIKKYVIESLKQEFVHKEQLKQANATSTLIHQIAIFSVPVIAAILIKLWGTSVLFLANGISIFIAGIIMWTIHDTPVIKNKEKPEFTLFWSIKNGYKKGFGKFFIIFCLGVSLGMMIQLYEIYKVYVSDVLLNLGAEGILAFSFSMAIGGLISLLLSKIFLKPQKLTANFYGFMVLCLSIIMAFWGNEYNRTTSFILLSVGAIFFSLVKSIPETYLQENVKREYTYHTFFLYQIMTVIGSIVGVLLATPLLELWNPGLGFIIVFGITFLALIFLNIFHKNNPTEETIEQK